MSNTTDDESITGIAIIGMACRFPGATNSAQFWENLRAGVESISFFSDQEMLAFGVDPTLVRNPNFIKAESVLEDIDCFDASFFGFNRREAEIMDPQQRLFLECTQSALEDAGYDTDGDRGIIGLYAGVGTNNYMAHLLSNPEIVQTVGGLQTKLANEKDYLTTRIAYKLNLRGPCVTVQTACSTSLVATHLACQSLLNFDCDMALAGGSTVMLPHRFGYVYQEGGVGSPDGHCRAFDARAQGTVGGSGVGVVVLKRLTDALAARDHIYAVIKGSAINNDGSLKVGFTAPSQDGQAAVIAEAISLAGISPDMITYVEAHGTGTTLGDPIELAAITQVFRRSTAQKAFCAIGSVKTNIGHLDAAAGIAGLIKTALALTHRQIPASLNFEQPNPKINFSASPFFVSSQLTDWVRGAYPRYAGVSSFGIGGTNAHVIVTEAPAVTRTPDVRPWQLILLSAKTEAALEQMTDNLAMHLKSHADLALNDVAYTLSVGRRVFPHRRMLVCRDSQDAVAALESRAQGRVMTAARDQHDRPIVFLFPGQGVQQVGMMTDLYHNEPVFREHIDRCATLLEPDLGCDLRAVLYPVGREERANHNGREQQVLDIDQTWLTQVALFSVEYALAQLWLAWGIRPHALIGHSIGEYVAACLAGVFSLEDALRLVAARGRLMQSLPEGAMLAVPLAEAALLPFLGPDLSLAAVNAPALCVVAGSPQAVDALTQRLGEQRITCQRLQLSHASHSAMMEPILAPFAAEVRRVRLSAPQIPYISNVTGTWITAAEATDPAYWVKQLRQSVRFDTGLRTLFQEPRHLLLEVGPGQTLSALARWHPSRPSVSVVLASFDVSKQPRTDRAALLTALGRLWLAGAMVDWAKHYESCQRVPLPTYPFAREHYWIPLAGKQAVFPNKLQTEGTMAPSPVTAQTPSARHGAIISTLRGLLHDLTGTNPDELHTEVTLFDLGLDSLILIQFNQALQDTLGVRITLIQLLEDLTTLDRIATHLDQRLPPEHLLAAAPPAAALPAAGALPAAPPMVPSTQPTILPAGTASLGAPLAAFNPAPTAIGLPVYAPASDNLLERVITQQLQLMAHQLETIRTNGAAPSAPPPALPVATAQVTTASTPAPTSEPQEKVVASRPKTASAPYIPYRPVELGSNSELTPRQRHYLDEFIARYTSRTQRSKQLTQRYRSVLADNRPTAVFRLIWKEIVYPIIGKRSAGSKLWDADGNEYIDVTMGFGVHLFGHSPKFIMDAMAQQMQLGVQLGPQAYLAGEVAKLICELTGVERVNFCNSGTEAVLGAIRIARTVTRRTKIALFANSYHGWADETLARAITRNGQRFSVPMAPGVPAHTAEDVLVLEYDHPESLELIRAHAHELAAVLVEPVQSRRPDVQPREFLHALRALTAQVGIPLIFDEMVNGFRIHPGGAQAWFGIQADIVTYGKIVGGGLPIGVIAGKALYLDSFDGGMWDYGDGSYPQAEKTLFAAAFFKHPLTMAAALAVLNHLKISGPALHEELNQRTARLAERLNTFFEQQQVPIQIIYFSSLFRFNIPREEKYLELIFYHLVEKGIYIWEGANFFLSTAHTEEDIERLIQAVKESVADLRRGGFLPDLPDPVEDSRTSGATPIVATPTVAQAEPQRPLPLTEPQRGLWVLAQFGADEARLYNEALAMRFQGPFQMQAMRAAFQAVVARHESLRTTISHDGEHQYVAASLCVDIPMFDFSALAPRQREPQLARFIAQATRQTFHLERGPLFSAQIIKLAEQEHALVLTIHHIITDGWSVDIVIQEIKALYSAACRGTIASLPEPLQFRAYVAWLDQQERQGAMAEAAAYWQGRFSDLPPALELPTDRGRPPVRTLTGAEYVTDIDANLGQQLAAFAAQHGCTLFMVLLSGFAALLHRLSGQQDLVVGVPTAGQLAMGGKYLTGYCLNLLPVRSTLTDSSSFSDYLPRIKRSLLEAYTYPMYPFGTLIKQLHLGRDRSRPPLVSVVFNLEKGADGSGGSGMADLVVKPIPCFNGLARFDMNVNVVETAGAISLRCDYNADLFDQATIQRWFIAFRTFLTAFLAHPTQPISRLPLLSDTAYTEVMITRNETRAAYPDDRCFHQLFAEQVGRTPDAVAVLFADHHLSYRALDQRANQLARYLQSLGVGPEMRVGICLERSLELVIGLLGIFKAGGAFVPLDPSFPAERMTTMLDDAGVTVVLTQGRLRSSLPLQQPTMPKLQTDSRAYNNARPDTAHPIIGICLDSQWSTIAQMPTAPPLCTVDAHNLAYQIYTSGSTGRPKGVLIPHRGLVNYLAWCVDAYGLVNGRGAPVHASIAADAIFPSLFAPLLVGAIVMIMPNDHPLEALASTLQKQRPLSMIKITPSQLEVLHQHLPHDQRARDGVRTLVVGAEEVRGEVLHYWQTYAPDTILLNEYGPTETVVGCSIYSVPRGQMLQGTVPIGLPIANTQFYVLDRLLQPVPIGVPGELYIGGEGVAWGYHNRPDLTAEAFVPNPFAVSESNTQTPFPGSRLYKTGDMVRQITDRQGNIEFLGRIDDQVKIRGYRVEPGEVAAALYQHPDVREAVVLAREESPGDRRLIAYVVSNHTDARLPSEIHEHGQQGTMPYETRDAPELRAFLQHILPVYMLPSAFVFLRAIPLTAHGKIDRHALPAPDVVRPVRANTFQAPRTPIEEQIVEMWQQILGFAPIGLHDHFFDLGGDSLHAVRLIAKLRTTFQIDLPARTIFDKPTIEELATVVAQQVAAGVDQETLAQMLTELETMSQHDVLTMLFETS